jgi:hydrogenase maturation protease
MSGSSSILILGVGNALLTDDGVGIHAARALQREPMPGVTVVEIGTAILHGLSFLESASRVLVIDAAQGGQPAGTIYLFDAGDPPALQPGSSLHALGLREAARLLMPKGSVPPITVLGVEPESMDYGTELSGPVRSALPRVVALARKTVAGWAGSHAAPAACAVAA